MISKNWCSEKFGRPQACTFSKTDASTGVFPVNVAKFLRPPFLQKTALKIFLKSDMKLEILVSPKLTAEFLRKVLIVSKKLLQKDLFFGFWQESDSVMSFFTLKIRPKACNFIKKKLWHRCFPVNFAEFLRAPFLQNTSGRLFLGGKSQ